MTVDSDAAPTGRAQTADEVQTTGDGPSVAHADGLWAERTGPGCYTGRNVRGAQVRMGPIGAGDVFTPGELLKIALAGCAGMSADHSLARRLGADVSVTVHVSGPKHAHDERYPTLHEELVVDLSGLPPAEQDRVVTVVRRAIDRNCTVGRTLERGTDVHLTIVDTETPVAAPPGSDGSRPTPRAALSAGQ
jgi:uncharacterized OsmC-like protein